MKSIVKKLRYCLALLLLGLFSFTAARAQTEGVPTDEEVNELLSTRDSRTLSAYLEAQGYTNGGIVPGSAQAYETDVEEDGLKTSSIGFSAKASPFKIRIRIIIIIIIHKKNGADPVYQSVSAEKRDGVTSSSHAIAENNEIDYTVAGGQVLTAAKSASSFASKFQNCWNRYVSSAVSNCTACYNCLKSCFSSGWWGSKLWCALWNCGGKCVKCIGSIYSFYKCVTG